VTSVIPRQAVFRSLLSSALLLMCSTFGQHTMVAYVITGLMAMVCNLRFQAPCLSERAFTGPNGSIHDFIQLCASSQYLVRCQSEVLDLCAQLYSEAGSSVSIVSGHGLDDWAIEVRSPAEAKAFFL
jgi:hypothetical protein